MKNQLKTLLLLGILTSLLVGVGSYLAPGYSYVFALGAIGFNFFAYFFSDSLVLRMQQAHEIPPNEMPELHQMVEEIATRYGMPKPRVYLVEDPNPNAFATGRNPAHGAVAVTTGILGLLTQRELRGVLSHELSHIRNRDVLISTIAAGIAAAISSLAHVLSFSSYFGGRSEREEGSAGGGLLVALVAPFLAMLVQLGVSRSREYLADQSGAEISDDPEALASALEKLVSYGSRVPSTTATPVTASLFIVNPFSAEGLSRLFSTHPPLEERIARLRAMSVHGDRHLPLRSGNAV
jgi:heat shock protein HtpX